MEKRKLQRSRRILTYRSDCGKFGLLLNERVMLKMLIHARKSGLRKTGGILIGRYSEDLKYAIVSIVTGPPADSDGDLHEFYRGVESLNELVADSWKEDRYYLGEWHTHLHADPVPDRLDIDTMMQISEDDENYHCPEPILIVLAGDAETNWRVGAFSFPRHQGMIEMEAG